MIRTSAWQRYHTTCLPVNDPHRPMGRFSIPSIGPTRPNPSVEQPERTGETSGPLAAQIRRKRAPTGKTMRYTDAYFSDPSSNSSPNGGSGVLPITLGRYQKWLEEQNKSPFTVRGYVRDIEQFRRWSGSSNGSFPVDAISEGKVRIYRAYLLKERNAKPRTFNRKLAALRSFVEWLQESGAIDQDPIREINMIREERGAPRCITNKEIKALEKATNSMVGKASNNHDLLLAIRDRALLYTLANTGVRLAEVCALDMSDVQISAVKGSLRIRNLSLSKRVVPLNEQARKALKGWVDVRPETQSQAVFIAVRSGGSRLSRRAVQCRISKIGQAANVNITAHVLRHTVARRLLDAGEELETVARLLGHRDLNSTRQYISDIENDLEKAVNLL